MDNPSRKKIKMEAQALNDTYLQDDFNWYL